MLYLGWIAAAFLAGGIVAWTLAERRFRTRASPSLRERFAAVDSFRGLSEAEILRLANAAPQSATRLPDGKTLRTWTESGYSISLLFDEKNVCLGVQDERL